MINFTIPITPIPKGRPRAFFNKHIGRISAYTPKETRAFEKTISLYCLQYKPEKPFNKPLSVVIIFGFVKPKKPKFNNYPAVKSDIDNLAKAILDPANGILWEDDSLICDLTCMKKYSKEPYIEIAVCELE